MATQAATGVTTQVAQAAPAVVSAGSGVVTGVGGVAAQLPVLVWAGLGAFVLFTLTAGGIGGGLLIARNKEDLKAMAASIKESAAKRKQRREERVRQVYKSVVRPALDELKEDPNNIPMPNQNSPNRGPVREILAVRQQQRKQADEIFEANPSVGTWIASGGLQGSARRTLRRNDQAFVDDPNAVSFVRSGGLVGVARRGAKKAARRRFG